MAGLSQVHASHPGFPAAFAPAQHRYLAGSTSFYSHTRNSTPLASRRRLLPVISWLAREPLQSIVKANSCSTSVYVYFLVLSGCHLIRSWPRCSVARADSILTTITDVSSSIYDVISSLYNLGHTAGNEPWVSSRTEVVVVVVVVVVVIMMRLNYLDRKSVV